MEKKTIGKLISVLRRANGMTQKELGEKLFVSDKTVSRWECDECTPELSLIPVIAELFGVTADELLRGECNPRSADISVAPTDEERKAQLKAQNDKLVRRILHKKQMRYKNLSMISIGIALVGLIVAVICDLGFYRGILGCCLASVFYLAGMICQCWFVTSARYNHYDEEDHSYDEMIARANSNLTRLAVKVLCTILALFAFTLPIAIFTEGAYTGLNFLPWLLCGMLFAGVTVILVHVLYVLFVRKILIGMSLLTADEKERAYFTYQKKFLGKMIAIVAAIGVVWGIVSFIVSQFGYRWVVKPVVFDNYEDFVAFMEEGAVNYREDLIYSQVQPEGTSVDTYVCPTDTVVDKEGNVLCEYKFHPSFASSVHFSFDTSEDGLPVSVITRSANIRSGNVLQQIQQVWACCAVTGIAVCAMVYVYQTEKRRKA